MNPISPLQRGASSQEMGALTPSLPTALQLLIRGAFAVTLTATLLGLLFSLGDKTLLVSVSVLIAGLLVLVEALPRVVEFAIGPVRGTLDRLEQGQHVLASDVQALRVALCGIVTKFEVDYLRRLAREEPWMARYEPDLYHRLKRLDDMGFVLPTVIDGQRRLMRIPELFGDERVPVEQREWFDVKAYAEITESGRKYLELYDAVVKHA